MRRSTDGLPRLLQCFIATLFLFASALLADAQEYSDLVFSDTENISFTHGGIEYEGHFSLIPPVGEHVLDYQDTYDPPLPGVSGAIVTLRVRGGEFKGAVIIPEWIQLICDVPNGYFDEFGNFIFDCDENGYQIYHQESLKAYVTEMSCDLSGNQDLTSISLPKTLCRSYNLSFAGCTNLKSASFYLSRYRNCATVMPSFDGCTNLTSVSMGLYSAETDEEGNILPVEYDSGSFTGCKNLSSISYPDGLKYLSMNYFSGCIYNHRTTKTNQKYPSVNL